MQHQRRWCRGGRHVGCAQVVCGLPRPVLSLGCTQEALRARPPQQELSWRAVGDRICRVWARGLGGNRRRRTADWERTSLTQGGDWRLGTAGGNSAGADMSRSHSSGSSLIPMRFLSVTHPVFELHTTGRNHPERPARLAAALRGVEDAPGEIVRLDAPEVDRSLLELVHTPGYVDQIQEFCLAGGGALDPDTRAVEASWEAAVRSAGAGVAAVEALEQGLADTAFLTVRPPGHHALEATAMGFCLFNNIAVTARMLTERGDRVAIVDWDVHHGNGSEEMFAAHNDILYLSFHQYPFYPGTGWLSDMGTGPTAGTTINLPLPAGTAGDLYREAFPTLVTPVLRAFAPDWVLVSAGYDAFAGDPLTELMLLPSDYSFMAGSLLEVVPASRTVFFLEGGYDLDGIKTSVSATLSGSAGIPVPDESLRYESPDAAFQVLEEVGKSAGAIWGV